MSDRRPRNIADWLAARSDSKGQQKELDNNPRTIDSGERERPQQIDNRQNLVSVGPEQGKETDSRPRTTTTFDSKFVPLGYSMGSSALGLVGILLCCTIIGAIIGIPLILGTMLGPKKGGYRGSCPHCGTTMSVGVIQAGANCHACKGRVVVKEGHFVGF